VAVKQTHPGEGNDPHKQHPFEIVFVDNCACFLKVVFRVDGFVSSLCRLFDNEGYCKELISYRDLTLFDTWPWEIWLPLVFIPCHRKCSQSEYRETVVYSTVLHSIYIIYQPSHRGPPLCRIDCVGHCIFYGMV